MSRVEAEGDPGRVRAGLQAFRLVRRFVLSALLWIPLYGAGGFLGLLLASFGFGPVAAQGVWSALAGWSLTGIYAVAGAVGGALAGGAAAGSRTCAAFERGVRAWLEEVPAERYAGTFPSMPLQDLRGRYEQAMDQMFASTLGRFRLPAVLGRIVRSRFRQAVVEDFIADCERRGIGTVDFPEVRGWLIAKGVPLTMMPVYAQLRLWYWVPLGALGLLAVLPFVLRLVSR